MPELLICGETLDGVVLAQDFMNVSSLVRGRAPHLKDAQIAGIIMVEFDRLRKFLSSNTPEDIQKLYQAVSAEERLPKPLRMIRDSYIYGVIEKQEALALLEEQIERYNEFLVEEGYFL